MDKVSPTDFYKKVADEHRYLKDHHAERVEKNKVDSSIAEQIKADLEALIKKNDKK